LLPRLVALIESWQAPIAEAAARGGGAPHGPAAFTESDTVLIAYGDHLQQPGEPPLATLHRFCQTHLRDAVSTVHVLPFHPSTSYEGYAISDYSAVDSRLGTWTDVEALGADFDLMMDWVLNHTSASHPWFRGFLAGEEPYNRYYIAVADPSAPWLRRVFRARDLPLLHPFPGASGLLHVWTTYSPDLIDLNWREPQVCLEMCRVLLESVARGARIVRLDAFVYVWKAEGESCLNQPQGHQLLELFQDVLLAAGGAHTALLPSITNVTPAENFAYFAADSGPPASRRADLIYNLPLSALLLHALYAHDVSVLQQWLVRLPPAPPGCAYLNLAASHDGIGLTWLAGLVPTAVLDELIAAAVAQGALLSSRRRTADGDSRPWELNATYFSACAPGRGEEPAHHVDRFLATHAVLLAVRGVPALYLGALLAGTNDYQCVERTGDNRAINRGRFALPAWEAAYAQGDSAPALVLHRLVALLRARRTCAAFHPEGAQQVLDLGSRGLLAIVRTAPPSPGVTGRARVLCLTNFADHPIAIALPAALAQAGLLGAGIVELVSGQPLAAEPTLDLPAYGTVWLQGEAADARD
jgi:sucrose phosphorylase